MDIEIASSLNENQYIKYVCKIIYLSTEDKIVLFFLFTFLWIRKILPVNHVPPPAKAVAPPIHHEQRLILQMGENG